MLKKLFLPKTILENQILHFICLYVRPHSHIRSPSGINIWKRAEMGEGFTARKFCVVFLERIKKKVKVNQHFLRL